MGTVADLVTVLDEDLYEGGLTQGYETDACIDLKVRLESAMILGHQTWRAPLGVRVDVPDGHVGLIVPRSSTASHGIHVDIVAIDPGYEGEVHTWLTYEHPCKYHRHDRFVGLMILPCLPAGARPRKEGARANGTLGSSDSGSPYKPDPHYDPTDAAGRWAAR